MKFQAISRGPERVGFLSLSLSCFFLVAFLVLALPLKASAQTGGPGGAQPETGDATEAETPVHGSQSDLSTRDAEAPNPGSELPSAVAQFTTAVENREPIDQITFVSTALPAITFFSDLRGLEGQTVIHRWIHKGETRAEVPFEVRGQRWRVWSSKELLAEWTGDWTVEIVDEAGEVIAAETFTYSAPDA